MYNLSKEEVDESVGECNLEQASFQLILHAGNAKSSAMEAISYAKKGDFENAHEKLDEANQELVKAHDIQTALLVKNAQGKTINIDILMVHAQDHLNHALTSIDFAAEIIDLYKVIKGC